MSEAAGHPFTVEAIDWLSSNWPTGCQRADSWAELSPSGQEGLVKFVTDSFSGDPIRADYTLPGSDETTPSVPQTTVEPGLTPGQVAPEHLDLALDALRKVQVAALVAPTTNLARFENGAGHYDAGGISTMDIIEAKIPHTYSGPTAFYLGAIIKYACRLAFKGQARKDAEKIRDYAIKLIECLDGSAGA